MKRVLRVVVVVLVVAVGAGWFLLLDNASPGPHYSVDLAEVRRLADAGADELPSDIRVERVASFVAPSTGVAVGTGFGSVEMTVYSYQLVYASKRVLVDTAMSASTTKEGGGERFDEAAFARVSAAMHDADRMVVTHEHFDHLGGLGAQPDAAALLEKTVLSAEQVGAVAEHIKPAPFPFDALKSYQPLAYDRLAVVAPGVVVIKAAGHTPGSQMVFVKQADGQEYLFVGDVAWHAVNIEQLRQRARLVGLMIGEDRNGVMSQLLELRRLQLAEPKLHIVPGHDAKVVDALVAAHALNRGFVTPAGQ